MQPESTGAWRDASAEEDREWVRQCQQGEEAGFEKLLRKYQQAVFNLVYHNLGPRIDAEDVAQKIFAKVYFAIHKFVNNRPFSPGSIASRSTSATTSCGACAAAGCTHSPT